MDHFPAIQYSDPWIFVKSWDVELKAIEEQHPSAITIKETIT
jgi:hypothetical protein